MSLENLSNEELVTLYQQETDDDVFELLFQRFHPMIDRYQSTYTIKNFDDEDFYQEGRIVLYKALCLFDPNRTQYFATYYHLLYHTQMANIIRNQNAKKRGGNFTEVPLEIIIPSSHGKNESFNILNVTTQHTFVTPEGSLMIKEKLHEFMKSLSPLEEVIKGKMKNQSFDEIAQKINTSTQRVRNAYDRCRQKLKKIIKIYNE